jgi:hypothetical protein
MSCRIYPSRPYTEIPRFRTVHIGSDIAEGCGDLIIIDCWTTIRTFDGCPAFLLGTQNGDTVFLFLAGMSLWWGSRSRTQTRAL